MMSSLGTLLVVIIALTLEIHVDRMISAFSLQKLLSRKLTALRASRNSAIDATKGSLISSISEILIVNTNNLDNDNLNVNLATCLKTVRPNISIVHSPLQNTGDILTWIAFDKTSGIQLDCTSLQRMYVSGKAELSVTETVDKWKNIIDKRMNMFILNKIGNKNENMTNLGDGGLLQYELNAAISIVQKASFVSRSLQHTLLLKGVESMSKDDKSPVTIADFVVQALIIRKLHEIFPHDRFIAEESSEFLKQNKMISDKVLFSLNSISDFLWTDKMLYETVDLGQYDYNASDSNSINRIWVLDPVDGTKGFMRGEHYCIALALLSPEKKPMMSVMGCPNINYKNVLESSTGNNKKISNIEPVIEVILDEDGSKIDAHVGETGTIFFSVSNRGSFVRSLSMLAGSAYEVSVKESLDPTNLTLCESVEASHGDRGLTEAVYKQMKLKNDFLRLDGQCKYAIVGAGGADGNMRLPPLGYIEKIWDHAPGTHFVIEAGGKVTDLNGILLDFGQGRLLPKCVTGIVASTGGELHDKILESIRISSKGVSNNENKRVFGQDSNK